MNIAASKIVWSVSVRAICQQGLVQSRAHGVLAPQTETSSRQIRASASHHQSAAFLPTFGSSIAAVLPRLRKLAARTFERGGPLSCARALAAHFSRKRRDIRPGFSNLCRAFK